MKIDTASLGLFGDMISGGGLNSIFNVPGTGYAMAVKGFAGFTLAGPTKIEKATFVSATNGFDASGLTTPITLKLMAKTGAAPANADDGVALGSLSFTDVNESLAKTIVSSDAITAFNHVWGVVQSGVWAILESMEVCSAVTVPLPVVGAQRTLLTKALNEALPMTKAEMEIPQLRIGFQVESARVARLDFHTDFQHIGDGVGYTDVIGMGARLLHRFGATQEAMEAAAFIGIKNGVGGCNIINRDPHHYGNKTVFTALQLAAGFHQFSVMSSAHTNAASAASLEGLGQIHPEYNLLCITVEEAGTQLIAL